VNLDADGVPTYIIHEDVAWDHIPFKDHTSRLAFRLDAVCYGSLAQRSGTSRYTLHQLLKFLNPGCLKVFDINLRQHYFTQEIIYESLQKSDILKLNEGELEVLSEMFHLQGTEKEKLETFLDRYSLKLVALTKGENGSLLITPEECSFLEAQPVKIADTVNTGDAFTAALTIGILKNLPLERIHFRANLLAGYVCSQQGAMPPVGLSLLAGLD
jgi:fructokinase